MFDDEIGALDNFSLLQRGLTRYSHAYSRINLSKKCRSQNETARVRRTTKMPSRADEMSKPVHVVATALYGRNGDGPPDDDKKGDPGMFLAFSLCLIL